MFLAQLSGVLLPHEFRSGCGAPPGLETSDEGEGAQGSVDGSDDGSAGVQAARVFKAAKAKTRTSV
eukprot:11226768-Lingulodinium_polyedra.AAC.1